MPSLLSELPKLTLQPRYSQNFIAPVYTPEGDVKHATLKGRVFLEVKRSTKVKYINVKLICQANVKCGELYTSRMLSERTINALPNSPEQLEPGRWEFVFDLPFPSTSPPTVKSVHGRVWYNLVAIAGGVGRFGADLEVTETIEIICAPNDPGSTPPALEFEHSGPLHEMGRYHASLVALWSNLGVLCLAQLSLAGPPVPAQIVRYTAKVAERARVVNLDDETLISAPPAVYRTIFDMVPSPGQEAVFDLAVEKPFDYQRWCRLPSHRQLFPSTDEMTDTPIRFSHEVIIEIHYRTALSPDVRIVRQSASVHIYSCLYFHKLPPYPDHEAETAERTAWAPHPTICECDLPEERQMKECREALLRRTIATRQPKADDNSMAR